MSDILKTDVGRALRQEFFGLEYPRHKLIFHDDFLGRSLDAIWLGAGTGSAVVVDGETNGIVRLATGGGLNNYYVLDWNLIRTFSIANRLQSEWRMRLGQTVDIAVEIRLYFDGDNRVGFFLNTVTDNKWHTICRSLGANTLFTTTSVLDTNFHTFRISTTPTAVDFYIDGMKTNTITTDIPTQNLEPYFLVYDNDTVAKNIDIDYFTATQRRT